MHSRRALLLGTAYLAAAAAVVTSSTILRGTKLRQPRDRAREFGELPPLIDGWARSVDNGQIVDPVIVDDAFSEATRLYDSVRQSDYVSAGGARVMVSAVYKREIEQETRFHWPEICYQTQGFEIRRLAAQHVAFHGKLLPISRFEAVNGGRREVVHYWMRIGDRLAAGSYAVRGNIFLSELRGEIPDGALFRASMLLAEGDGLTHSTVSAMLNEFMAAFLKASNDKLRLLLIG